jgi:hypothetical protein
MSESTRIACNYMCLTGIVLEYSDPLHLGPLHTSARAGYNAQDIYRGIIRNAQTLAMEFL